MPDKQKLILAIGAHIGDMELTTGGLLATCALKGWKVITVSLTASEKSAGEGQDLVGFKAMKVREATAFAATLGGEAKVFDIPDGLLSVNDELSFQICDLIRKYRPEIIVTHYKSSHKDHMACKTIVEHARFYASLAGFARQDPAFDVPNLYYAENWEDASDFKPYVYYDTSAGYALWKQALEKEESVMPCPFFPIAEYYDLNSRLRGMLMHCEHAECFMLPDDKCFSFNQI